MNGVHDLGGMHGFGPINPEANEPVFHHEWERRVFGIMVAILCGGHFGVDEFRHGCERIGQARYLSTTYFEHWFHALEMLLQEHGIVTAEELAAARAQVGAGAS